MQDTKKCPFYSRISNLNNHILKQLFYNIFLNDSIFKNGSMMMC